VKKEEASEFIAFLVTIFMLVLVAIEAFDRGFYYSAGSAIACMFLATLPIIFRRFHLITFPFWMGLWYLFLLWLHSFGILHDYYGRIAWFDELTHTMAIGLAACVIFLLLILLNHHSMSVRLPPLTFPLFMIIFAMGLGVTWEVLEFVLDVTIDTPMQYSLADSVSDLMTDLGGGLLASSACLIYLLYLDPDQISDALQADRLIQRYQRKYQQGH
jgi:hypothetical protein